jgi:hypothetical protein
MTVMLAQEDKNMATFTIRDVSEKAAAALKERAAAAGMNTEAFVRHWIESLTATALVRPHYTIRAYGPDKGYIKIERFDNNIVSDPVDLSFLQETVVSRAMDLIQRNHPGDRETAIAILGHAGFEVFES